MKLTLKRKIGAAATAVAIIGGAGIAGAYWTSTGTGSGSAKAGTDGPWVVMTDTALGDPLSPGGPTQDVAVHVTNSGSGVQHLNAVDVSVADTATDGSPSAWTSGACSAADFTVVGELPDVDVLAGATYDGTLTITMDDTGVNQDDCKGVTVPLYVSAS